MQTYYTESYQQAREHFLAATANADQKFQDTIAEDLTIDTAVFTARDPRTVLLIVSGTHGVEGYSGSAVQLRFLEHFLPHLNDQTTLVLIHALNPYGFARDRRVNAHNVDLNRAFHDHQEAYTTANPALDAALDGLHPLIAPKRPRGNPALETFRFYARILPTVIRAKLTGTYPALKNALAGGQYRYPDAPFYGGNGRPKEVEVFGRILREVTAGQAQCLVLDCHTGLGKRGEAVYFTANGDNTEAFKRLQKIEPTFTSIAPSDTQNQEIYEAKGSLVQYAIRHSQAKQTYAFGLDIGTISNIPLLYRIVAENQLHHYPNTPETIAQQVREDFREGFYPSEAKWRNDALGLYTRFLGKVAVEFGLVN